MSRLLDLPGLVYGIQRQLYHKVTSHWEAFFDKFRSWLSGRRDKKSFPKQKVAVAIAFARLLTCVELYNTAVTKWSSMGMPMVSLVTCIVTLSKYLEFLGKGVDSRNFDNERKKTWTITLAMQLSTGEPDASPETTTMPVARSSANAISSPGAVSIPSVLASPIKPVAPEDAHDFIFNCPPDPDVQQAWEEQITAHRLDLQKQLEEGSRSIRKTEEILVEEKQNVRNIIQQLDELDASLGLVKAPGPSIFDDNWATPTRILKEQSGSPGALTLVDSVLEVSIPSPLKEESPDKLPSPIIDFGLDDVEDVPMTEVTADKLDQNIDQTFVEIRKRKRFSKHGALKRVRGQDNMRHGGVTSPHSSGVSRSRYNMSQGPHGCGQNPDGQEIDEDAKHPATSRPTSWPRTSSRLFRYSAGVSVKKLTDVFENLGLKQRQP
ncbi:MAG: hypothetical protein Q9207_006695 [Kuettlingeria erythrocarpa]